MLGAPLLLHLHFNLRCHEALASVSKVRAAPPIATQRGRAGKSHCGKERRTETTGAAKGYQISHCRSQHEIRFAVVRRHGAYLTILGTYMASSTTATLANHFQPLDSIFAPHCPKVGKL